MRNVSDSADRTPAAEMQDSRPLGVWDAGSLIVGIVIGASLFQVPGLVFSQAGDPATGLLLWAVGGLLSLAGALCYCELATAWPKLGGDYVYLTRAYGPGIGFLFGWMRFAVILPANVGAMGFIFAEHARRVIGSSSPSTAWLAAGAVIVLTSLNLRGARLGKQVQNGLTLAKLAGLLLIVVAGAWLLRSDVSVPPTADIATGSPNYGLALVFVLYAYGGWNDAAFVAAEVRDARRNIPRALLLGLGSITAVYLVVNLSYVAGLGFNGVCETETPAAELLQRAWGTIGETIVSVIVMLSTLGAINGMLYSGSRVTASLGNDHRAMRFLGGRDPVHGAPVRALLAAGGLSLFLIWLVGTVSGQSVLSVALLWTGDRSFDWEPGEDGFSVLVTGTAPTFWMFMCLTAASVPLLRYREPDVERPFRCGIAVTPLILCATSVYMLWSSLTYARGLAMVGLAILVAGAIAYAVSARRLGSSD